jgi:class 3 adenylate cyclase/tetratricopeptide (TPR) repeat protein
VLFCDVTDSTPLAERRDPEAVRRIMSRYFSETSAVLKRHGGTVEKYIGDAVMAVFGIPRVHEDDALRAVRAATEVGERIAALNEELERAWGVRISIRIGVNTGEVVAGDPSAGQAFAAGEAVNIAQRLESAAPPGEILIGRETHRLTRDAVLTEAVEPLLLKGKSEPVPAWRVLGVVEGAPAFERRLDAPLVDREEELRGLLETFDLTVRNQACHLCTVLGPAGIGKSRMVSELLDEVGSRATAVKGRCLPYGDGITFWPLSQIVREAGGEEWLAASLDGVEDADLIADRIRAILGRAAPPGDSAEIFWAVRKLFEALATRTPLIVCLEDIHWAEPTFLELIEYLVGWSRDGPILLLCLARPELLEERPGWLSQQPNASAVRLEPLSGAESELLLDELALEAGLSPDTRGRIADAAEGNPLFIEQMAALAAEGGNGKGPVSIPATIHSLLAARLDRLEPLERAVIERAAVIGKEFWRGPVIELSPEHERREVGGILLRLVRKELLRPDRSTLFPDDAFRFRHVLIRDAAYAGIPKELRADLHERFAHWIERIPSERMTALEEIIGYHLEQAHRWVVELGGTAERALDLAKRAAARLGAAGARALSRGDVPAAVNLLGRATVLLRDDDGSRLAIAPDLAAALMEAGELARAQGVLARAEKDASELGEDRIAAHSRLLGLHLQLLTEAEEKTTEIRAETERMIPMLEAYGDELGLARSWYLLAQSHWTSLRAQDTAAALEHAFEHAVRSGDRREQNRCLRFLLTTIIHGPTRVEEGLTRCDEILDAASGDRTVESAALRTRARLVAMLGRFDEARHLMARGRAILTELGLTVYDAASAEGAASIELLADASDVAEQLLVQACSKLEEIGDLGYLPTLRAYLAEAAFRQRRYEEAERSATLSEETAAPDDLGSHVVARSVLARLLARRGKLDAAERLAREAVALAEKTDFINLRADALLSLCEVVRLGGAEEEARRLGREALGLYERKGNLASAQAMSRALRVRAESA